MFDYAVTIIYFGRIDFVELILIKSELNITKFMFKYVLEKVNFINF